MPERPWLYQTPEEILIKASNGASDFGNKFGQPLICGSLLTFEHGEEGKKYGFDKVIMLAGGIGFGKRRMPKRISLKKEMWWYCWEGTTTGSAWVEVRFRRWIPGNMKMPLN